MKRSLSLSNPVIEPDRTRSLSLSKRPPSLPNPVIYPAETLSLSLLNQRSLSLSKRGRCRSLSLSKWSKRPYLLPLCLCLYLCLCSCSGGRNPYHLDIVNTISTYEQSIAENPDNEFIDLEELIPGIILDIKYADTCNFTHTRIYTEPKAYLRRPAAEALRDAQKELAEAGLAFKVFDAYRPYAATLYFYEICKDTNFVAYPGTGSIHNRGCAVDLTLIDLATGEELEMPTGFDDFSKKAAAEYHDLPQRILANRQKLQYIMKKYGYEVYPPEWWHFNYKKSEEYKITDINFNLL